MGEEVRRHSNGGIDEAPEPPDRTLGWLITGIFVFAVCGFTIVAACIGGGLYFAGQQMASTTPLPTVVPTPNATQQAELNKLAVPPEGWQRTTLQFGHPTQWRSDAMAAPYGGKLDIFFNDADDYVWDMRPSEYGMTAARTSTIGGE